MLIMKNASSTSRVTRRPSVPIELKRRVKHEAGHRCAIPTCRQWPIELAHIVPYRIVKSHTFDNLIALCPTCHSRYDNTNDIDIKAMYAYKLQLSLTPMQDSYQHALTSTRPFRIFPLLDEWFQRRSGPERIGLYQTCLVGVTTLSLVMNVSVGLIVQANIAILTMSQTIMIVCAVILLFFIRRE